MKPAEWTWQLCDNNGFALGELTTASGKVLTFERNAPAEATCVVSHEDDAASLVLGSLSRDTLPSIPTLRCYRDGVLVFNGYLAPIQEQLEEAATLTLNFRSPFGRLLGEGNARGRYTDAFIEAKGKDAGQIAKSLIDLYGGTGTVGATDPVFGAVVAEDSFCGLGIGSIESSVNRDRQYQYANVGEEIVGLTTALDGFDWDEQYVDGGGATLARFNVYASQGADRPGALFQYGADTLANVRSVSRTIQAPINVVRLIGAYGLSSVQKDQPSIDAYGKWYYQETRSDIYDQATLDAKAHALLRPKPVKTITFVPEIGMENCPRPWDDYWKGDTVYFYGRRGAFLEDTRTVTNPDGSSYQAPVPVRVNKIVVPINDNGFEAPEIPDPLSPEEQAFVRASLSIEVVP